MFRFLPRALFCSSRPIDSSNLSYSTLQSDTYTGLKPIRKLTPQQIKIFKTGYEIVKQENNIQQDGQETNWYNISIDGQLQRPQQNQFWKSFDETVKNLFYQAQKPQNKIYSYGFIVNPINNKKNQFYHFDYAKQTGLILVTLSYFTTQNSTQYLSNFVPNSKPLMGSKSYNNYGHSDIQLLQLQNVDFLEVSQVISRPYVIFKAGLRTIHRGASNRGDYARPAFFINYGTHDYVVKQPPVVSFTRQKNLREQKQQKGQYKDYYKQ